MQVRDQRRLEFIGTRTRPLAVTSDGVDFTVMREVAERLRQRPARYGVSGKALVKQADGRFQTQVREGPGRSAADPPAYTDLYKY